MFRSCICDETPENLDSCGYYVTLTLSLIKLWFQERGCRNVGTVILCRYLSLFLSLSVSRLHPPRLLLYYILFTRFSFLSRIFFLLFQLSHVFCEFEPKYFCFPPSLTRAREGGRWWQCWCLCLLLFGCCYMGIFELLVN